MHVWYPKKKKQKCMYGKGVKKNTIVFSTEVLYIIKKILVFILFIFLLFEFR